MTSLNNGAPASAQPAYLKSEVDRLEARLSTLQNDINNAKDAETAAILQGGHNSTVEELKAKRAEHHEAVLANLPEPVPLMPGAEKPTPYPLDELPQIIRDAVRAIAERVKAPQALAGQCVIGAIVYLALTRADAENSLGDAMPINIAMLSLADSGDRKSTCHHLAFLPISNQQQELAKRHKAELDAYNDGKKGLKGQQLIDYEQSEAAPMDYSTLYSDVTFERIAGDFVSGKPLIFWDTDEGGQVLGGHSLKSDTRVSTIGGLTQLLDRGFASRMRSRGNLEASGTVYNRRFAVHLMAQEVAVQEALRDPLFRGQGFLARFLLTAPESLKGTRMLTREEYERQRSKSEADPRLGRYWKRVSALLDSPDFIDSETGDVSPPIFNMTLDAHELWRDLFNSTESKMGKFGALGEVSTFAARVGDQARKLATALAVFEGLNHVDAACMQAAAALAKHSVDEWLRYTAGATISREIRDASTVMSWLTEPKRIDNWNEFTRDKFGKSGFKPFRPAKKRDAVLATLLENNHLLSVDGRTFVINPLTAGAMPRNSADCAEKADSQQQREVQSAEEVRTSAEVSAVKNKSAPIRTLSAHANPYRVGVSAQSAQSAPTPQTKTTEKRLAL